MTLPDASRSIGRGGGGRLFAGEGDDNGSCATSSIRQNRRLKIRQIHEGTSLRSSPPPDGRGASYLLMSEIVLPNPSRPADNVHWMNSWSLPTTRQKSARPSLLTSAHFRVSGYPQSRGAESISRPK